MDKKKEAIKKLKEFEQEHIIGYLEKIGKVDINKKEELIEQILNMNFEQVSRLYKEIKKEKALEKQKIEAIKYLSKEKLTFEQKEEFQRLAQEVFTKGEYAVVTMAGGQRNKIRAYRT